MKNDILLAGNGLLVLGLCLGLAAGIFLAYDALHGAGARFQAEVAATQLRNLRIFRAQLQQGYRNFTTPWTEADKEALLAEEENQYGPQERALAEHAGSMEDKYKGKVEVFAIRGLLMLIGAFVLQLAGTAIVALESVRL
jgi:hypothetical protein